VAALTYVRDRIELDDGLSNELQEEMNFREIAKGTTVCLLAREIVHASEYTFALSGHPLVLVADTYNGNGGAIDTTTHQLFAATDGAAAKGTTPGGDGGHGASASAITVVAQKVLNARLVARGNPGGNGGNAANGGNGTNAKRGEKIGGALECFPGHRGPDGGRGGNGGNGGQGGEIAIHFMTTQGDLQIDSAPGAGGKGGAKGIDGKRGTDAGPTCHGGEAGKGGVAGADGKTGTAGTVTKDAVSDADTWWKLVVDLAGKSAATQWSSHRTGVGEYTFRSYVPAAATTSGPSLKIRKVGVGFDDHLPLHFEQSIFRPVKATLLAKARKEFESALILLAKVNGHHARTIYTPLSVTNKRAKVLLGYINNGMTPIGVGYQHDLRPDFEFYEEFITDYQGHKDALFETTLRTLLDIKDTSDKGDLAKAARDHAQGMAGAAQIDVTIAESQRQAAEVAWEKAKGRLYAIQQALIAVQEARKNSDAEISFGDVVKGIGVVVGAVIAIVGAVQSAGTTVAAWLAAVGALASTAAAAGEAVDNLETWVDLSNPSDPKLTAAGQKVKGSLTDAIDKTMKLVDKVEAVAQLFAAQGDDEFDEKERQLLVDAFDAAYEVNMRFIDHEHAKLAAESAKQKEATYTADTEALSTLTAGFEQDVDAVARVAKILIRQFQDYLDYFLWYGFRRDRAFDLYTLADPPRAPRFPFDYGYLHPDLKEDAFFALGRRDPARVLDLVEAYVKSLALFDPAALREEYDDYWNHLGFEGHVAVPITDPVALSGLKGSKVVSFDVPISTFSPSTELKIWRTEVSLIGASVDPNHDWVQVELEHCGDATNLRHDKTSVVIKAPPRRELSPAQVQGINPNDLDESSKQQFWGRSPAARWRIRIPEESAAAAGLDLSGLSQIQLAIRYSYYVRGLAIKKPAIRRPR
jgi:hypothetical protein